MTDPGMPAERASVARPLIVVFIGFAALVVAVVFVLRSTHRAEPDRVFTRSSPPVTIPPPIAPDAPSFGIVRIDPHGGAVIAGHADPGAEVTVHDGQTVLGHAKADSSGDWVLVPGEPLPPGARELSLSEKTAQNVTVAGTGSVAMVVPAPATPAIPSVPALALLDQPGTAPRLLQGPTGGQPGKLALAAVDYDDHGALRFAGTAPAGATVRVYVDDRATGDAVTDPQGRWSLSPAGAIAPGQHRLRLDQLDAGGRVAVRIALPFMREQITAAQLADNRVLVQPGESLWRIARNTYGAGIRYTVIYQANQGQIRDPARIYPGQALDLPQDLKPLQ
jgi:nucleoid-associated protein YgaU